MGNGKSAIFLIDPVNLPVVFRIQPMTSGIVECRSRSSSCKWDARVAGSLKSLLGMIQGNLDGDALFFSRDISIEGDTEAVVALRNAIDAAEIDLIAEIGDLFGPFRPLVTTSTRAAISVVELLTGKTLLGTN
jgi:predicted lipid carrier protein YhbT